MRAIYILWMRALKRYSRSRVQAICALGQPLLFLFGLGFGMERVFQDAGQGSYIRFLSPGVIGMALLMTAFFSGMGLIWDRHFGFLKETLVAPVPRLFIVIGRIFGGATVATAQGVLMMSACMVVGFRPGTLVFLPLTFLFMMLISIMFSAMGTAIAARIGDFQGFQLVVNLLVMPMFFLSGSLFPLAGLPKPLAFVASINPLSFAVDGLRYGLTGSTHFGVVTDLAVLLALTAAFLLLAGYLFSNLEP